MRVRALLLSAVAGLALGSAVMFTPHLARAADPGTPPNLHLQKLTWMEIKAAVNAGYTSVLVPSGGTEQNGPHMVLDKHNLIVGAAAEKIASEVGHMLIAPTLTIVPEGDFAPASGNMVFPGTIGLSPEAYEGVLDGVARSMKNAGFRTIFFIGDHGQSQEPQQNVADRLTAEWESEGVRVIEIGDYYDATAQNEMLASRGYGEDVVGFHAGLADTAEAMGVTLDAVRPDILKNMPQPLADAGASGDPTKATAELGKELLDMRINAAVAKIRTLLPQ